MVGFFASARRGAISCGLATSACAAFIPSTVQAQTGAPLHIADAAVVTRWSLPQQSGAVGRLPEPTFVTPPPIDPLSAGKLAHPSPVQAAAVAVSPPLTEHPVGPQLAVEDSSARGFRRSDRLQPFRTPRDIQRLEIAFHLLNAADAISTVACLQRDDCQEKNPVYGKRPKAAVVIGAKALTSGVHYWVMRTLLPDHPGMARAFGWFGVTVQGTVVGLNMRQLF